MGAKSRELRELYTEARSVVDCWQVAEFASKINVVDHVYLLGKDSSKTAYLDDDTMATARLN